MSDQAAITEPVPPATPAHAEGWFARLHLSGAHASPAAAGDVAGLLTAHSAGFLAHAAKVLTDPRYADLRAEVLDLTVTAAKIAGLTL
jgi:hypothetical protein